MPAPSGRERPRPGLLPFDSPLRRFWTTMGGTLYYIVIGVLILALIAVFFFLRKKG